MAIHPKARQPHARRSHPILEILAETASWVAINKPSGLLVHRSALDKHETQFALQLARDQVGCKLFPVHRLDKPTSGVLLFAKSSDAARELSAQLSGQDSQKIYLAVHRGWTPTSGVLDHPIAIRDRRGNEKQTALTWFVRLAKAEISHAVEGHATSRYSLCALRPITGRRHQLRRHMKNANYPMIGDTTYGRSKHNRFFASHYESHRLLLHAAQLHLGPRCIEAALDSTFMRVIDRFAWRAALPIDPEIFNRFLQN